ncbi:hypothetical protein [Mesorhizobium sp. NPDC059025]|uniref:hypothetical protein n=1 Tax=unclassified Mesorhizobium TaxID=325217 RepID=UPI0036BDA6EC
MNNMVNRSHSFVVLRPSHRLVIQFTLVLLYRLACDWFAWQTSRQFGQYGIATVGSPFSSKYFLSIAVLSVTAAIYSAFLNRRLDVFDVGLAFLFLTSYVPVTVAWWITAGSDSYFGFVTLFWVSILSLSIGVRWKSPSLPLLGGGYTKIFSIIYSAIIIYLGILLYLRFGAPVLTDFGSAYTLRAAFNEWLPKGLLTYLFSWSVYVFAIYLLIISKEILFKLIALIFIMMIFSASGNKVYILMLPILLFLHLISVYGFAWLMAPTMAVGVVLAKIIFDLGEVWIPTFVQRFLIMPADIAFRYAEYFREPLLYSYSFLSPFFTYRYDDLPGKLIGKAFYVSGDNATAGFAVDMFTNLGWIGLPILVVFFVALRRVLTPGAHLVLLLPFVIQLIDTPLPTALLTGGGGLMIAGAFLISRHRILVKPSASTSGSAAVRRSLGTGT